MRLVLLSRSAKIGSTSRLVEAARERRLHVRVLDPRHCEIRLGEGQGTLTFRRRPIGDVDVVIPRIAASINHWGLAVLNQLGLAGVTLVNGPGAIAQSRNKIRCLQLLATNGIPIPPTVIAQSAHELKEMVPLVGGMPVLVKLLHGRPGVMVCETPASLEASLEAIFALGQDLLLQQYVRAGHGQDFRALVVGGEVIAAVRRKPRAGRFQRTLGRGASYEPVTLPPAFERAALTAARLVGLEVAAIDLLEHEGAPLVFEVNSSPSLVDLEAAVGRDLAGAVVDHALALVRRDRAEAARVLPLARPPAAAPGESPPPRRVSRRKRPS